MTARSHEIYADFLLPHIGADTRLVDVGCGSGELSMALASVVASLVGVDNDADEIGAARRAAADAETDNATFVVGSAYDLALPDGETDAVIAHSVLEAVDNPGAAIVEARRVLRPGGILGVASVAYDGLILGGPHEVLTRRFYEIRQRLWAAEGADPYLGRRLRGLLLTNGFVDVEATTLAVSYGTIAAVREFGTGRADDCEDEWYVESAIREGLATRVDLEAMRKAWLEWSEAPTSYAAFTWCRALGWKPRADSTD